MFRIQFSSRRVLLIATLTALGASGTAFADDSSMSRFGGESYAYFNQRPATVDATASAAAWRRAHPNGLTERELLALSSSDLSAATAQINPAAFYVAAADPAWRETHPNGLAERELQALSSSSLAQWQAPGVTGMSLERSNVAVAAAKGTLAARFMNLFRPESGAQAAQ
jgi:hypothetical protein